MVWDIQNLFKRHAKELRRSLSRKGLGADVAEDITQDTFVRLLTAKPTIRDGNARAYLFEISRNLFIDHERRRCAAPFDEITEEVLVAVADPTPSAETALYDKQRLLIAEAALAELPVRTKLAFVLHRLDGKTIAEVARQIGLSTTQTWSLIRDAYRHIRRRLRDI